MKRLYIRFFHGRVAIDESLEGWGFEGPVVGPLSFIQTTYRHQVRFGFEQSALGAKNALALDFCSDDDDIHIEYHEDMAVFEGFYFGDWFVEQLTDQEAKAHNAQWFKEKPKLWSRQISTTLLQDDPIDGVRRRIMRPAADLEGSAV